MPSLPALRRASCGHYVPQSTKPVGIEVERGVEVYLCAACKAALKRPKIERKA